MTHKVTVHYFDIKGRGELIRLALAAGNVEFTDHRIKFEDWPNEKAKYPFNKVPCLEVDGVMYPETWPCLKLAGVLGGLYPTEMEQCGMVDAAISAMQANVMEKFKEYITAPEDKRDEIVKRTSTKDMPEAFAQCEAGIKKLWKGKYIIDKPSVADVSIYYLVTTTKRNENVLCPQGIPDFDTKFPTLTAIANNISTLPGIQRHDQKK